MQRAKKTKFKIHDYRGIKYGGAIIPISDKYLLTHWM